MRLNTVVRGAVLCAALVAFTANAQTSGSSTATQRWTVDSGTTVGDGANVVRAQVGWPGLWLDFVHGMSSTFDIGGRLGLNWGGPDGAVNYCASAGVFGNVCGGTTFNIDFQLLLRATVTEIAGYKLALTFNPGFIIFTSGGTTGINLPIGAQMGFPINEKMILNASFEVPMYATFGTGGSFFIPLLFGGGIEYAIQPNLLLTGKLALGVSIPTLSGAAASFAMNFLAGVAYKF